MHNKNFFIKTPLIISVAFLFLLLAGCSRVGGRIDFTSDGEPVCGDMIVEAASVDATTLIPIVATDSASHSVSGLIYNGLIKYDENLRVVGDLAESWKIEDNGKTIIFKLRKDVLWHDGTPFTARDVKFTYNKLTDPSVHTPYSGDFLKVNSLEIVDNYVIKVSYKEPFAPALSSWSMSIIPEHILQNEDLNNTEYSRKPIGTGPYKFKRWKSGQRIDLVANPYYFDGRPFISRYIYRIIPDQATMFLELQAESADIMNLTSLQYLKQTSNSFFNEHYNKFRYPSFGYTYLAYNLLDERFSDARVRKALNMAVNKQEIIDGVLMGLGRECTGPFVPESWAYNEEVLPAAFDPEAAKELLKEAGYSDTDNDKWVDDDGKIFEFTILTSSTNDQRRMAAEIIQKRLSQIGVKVNIRLVEWSVFLTEFVNKKRFEAVLLGWNLSLDPDCYDIWHSSKTRPGEFNFISYRNPEIDSLLEAGRMTFDQDKRAQIYHKVHKILYDEQPYMFLYVPEALPIVHKRIKGVKPAPVGIGYNFIKWYVPQDQQKYGKLR
ncbi:MAG: peptide-binding protein [Candidatus Omnitrophota bacterium]